jgi:hypothetical protein
MTAALAYALAVYVLVLVIALWFLGRAFLGPVALTGAIVCGAGALIGLVLGSTKRKAPIDDVVGASSDYGVFLRWFSL